MIEPDRPGWVDLRDFAGPVGLLLVGLLLVGLLPVGLSVRCERPGSMRNRAPRHMW